MCESGHFPHAVIDRAIWFRKSISQAWVNENLTEYFDGKPFKPIVINKINYTDGIESIKDLDLHFLNELSCIADRLYQLTGLPPGIYFLIKSSEIVYISKSVCPFSRIKSHKTNNKLFDHAYLLPAPEIYHTELETELIKLYQPPLNNEIAKKLKTWEKSKYKNAQTLVTKVLKNEAVKT